MRKKSDVIKGFKIFSDLKYRLILEGVGVGIFVGIIISLFRLLLLNIDNCRDMLVEGARVKLTIFIFCLILLFAFLFICAFIKRREPLASGSGIPQIKGELDNEFNAKWWKVLIYKFIGSLTSTFAGLSLGREGPSVQLGGMVGKGFSKLTKRGDEEEKYLIICGAGAGLAAAFGAPLAGVIFVLEGFRRKFSHKALLSTMSASITADWISSSIFGLKPVFGIKISEELGLEHFWNLFLLGIIVGICGCLYNKGIVLSQKIFRKLDKKSLGWPITFLIIALLGIIYPKVLGPGESLIRYITTESVTTVTLLILLIVKFIFSIYSFGTGSPGGIFLPLLVLGGLTGALYLSIFGPIFGLSMEVMETYIVLGMVGYFASIVRAPITGIILITEVTGALDCLLPLAIVSLIGYLTAEFLGSKPISDELLERMLLEKTKYVK